MLHSKKGFSGQHKHMVCGGNVAMSEGVETETNDAAELGTAVHELTEVALKFGLSCHDFIGMKFNGIIMSEDDAEAGQVYVNYVRQLKIQYPNMTFHIEKQVCMSSVSDELWGTSDFIGIDETIGLMIILDYKNGWGIVEIDGEQTITGYGVLKGNAQLTGYALAAMDSLQLWGKINKVITGIIQPNVEHIDGVIRLKEYNMNEMQLWHDGYRASHGRNDIIAGKHCTYCAAAGHCGVRINHTFSLLGLTSSTVTLSEDQVIAILNEAKTLKRTIEAVEKQALKLARNGKKLTDWKLVKAINWAKCKSEDEFVKAALKAKPDLDTSELYGTPRLKGMTACKKLLPATLVNEHFVKPEAGTVLVPISDKRAAIMPDSPLGKFAPITGA